MIVPFLFVGNRTTNKQKDGSIATEAKNGRIDPVLSSRGLLKNKTDPDFSGKSRSVSCVSRLYVHQILRRRAKSTKRNLSSRWIDSVYSKQRVSSRYTRLRTVETKVVEIRNSLLTGSTVISFCA